jgi:hypothetical protein
MPLSSSEGERRPVITARPRSIAAAAQGQSTTIHGRSAAARSSRAVVEGPALPMLQIQQPSKPLRCRQTPRATGAPDPTAVALDLVAADTPASPLILLRSLHHR